MCGGAGLRGYVEFNKYIHRGRGWERGRVNGHGDGDGAGAGTRVELNEGLQDGDRDGGGDP